MKKIMIPLGILLFASCYNDKEDQLYPKPVGGCDTANMSFATHIQPIMNQSCAIAGACHNATAKSLGHDLSSYAGTVAAVNSGRYLGAIRHETGFFQMPKGMTKLGDCEIAKITAWVNQGAKQ